MTWAPSSEFVSSSIPSWQILSAHAQPFRGARDLAFCLKVPLDLLLVWASSGGSGETARMRRLAWTFAARIGDKYQIRLTLILSENQVFFNFFHVYKKGWLSTLQTVYTSNTSQSAKYVAKYNTVIGCFGSSIFNIWLLWFYLYFEGWLRIPSFWTQGVLLF